MQHLFIAILCASALFAEPSSLTVDLSDPSYKHGIFYTNQGGVIRGEDLRIQAQTIQYIRKDGVHKIEAEGDLFVQYKGRAFVGTELEYDVTQKSGTIYDGKTLTSCWFVGGDAIHLRADGSYGVDEAFITTCENRDRTWEIHAKGMEVIKDELLAARDVSFQLLNVPSPRLPSLKVNLKEFNEPLFKYDLRWDSKLGPRLSARYQLYSWQDFALYARAEYRLKAGFGGALETEYKPTEFDTYFATKSYLAKDRLVTATEKMLRYRVQGNFHSKSQEGNTSAQLTWDKYSDVRMPNDFRSDDFEINPGKQTLLYIRHRQDRFLASLKVRPRANPFESIKQDLPTLYATVRPVQLGSSKIFSSSYVKASYLDFAYSNQLTGSLPDFHSPRIELRETLYRTFRTNLLTATPYIGGTAIFYGNSPSQKPQWLTLASYGVRAEARGGRRFLNYKHQIEPYAEFMGQSLPTSSPDSHYIFSIQDGYDKINHLRLGVRNLLFRTKRTDAGPSFNADLYADAFFMDKMISQAVPYGHLHLSWHLPSLHFSLNNGWNFQEKTLQYSNARLLWTANENVSMSLEGRFRSRFDWRKADHDNFLLDVSRPQSELLSSPLSDQRLTLLSNIFIRLTPFWECRIQSHHGFLRKNEPAYNEVKVDLFTWISASLKLRLSFAHSADRGINSVGAQVYLVK